MSFSFVWPTFSEDFYADAREMLAQALNKGEKPPIIADRIEVKELNMGTIPPELEILEIGDLSTDRFRGIFRLTYAGDAYIVLQTKVQANPLNVPRPSLDILGSPRILFAAAPLVVPMTLRLSSLSLRAIVVLVVSRQKGITLVFKNDPLESVNVSSSFDGVESVAGFIQKEIEGQLREAFRSDLPGVIHRLSQKWLSGEVKKADEEAEAVAAKAGRKGKSAMRGFEKDAKIETRTYLDERGEDGRARRRGRGLTTKMSSMSVGVPESVSLASDADTSYSTYDTSHHHPSPLRRSNSRRSSFGPNPPPAPSTSTMRDDTLQSVPESIESYDPTYGLRPDSIPQHAGFADYERLVRSGTGGRGLGDVLEDGSEEEDDEEEWRGERTGDGSFDFDLIGLRDLVDDGKGGEVPDWEGSPSAGRGAGGREPYRSGYSFDAYGDESRYDGAGGGMETIPAVGGGTITRPRVFHTQSQLRTRTASNSSLSAHGSPSTTTARDEGSRTNDGAGSSSSTIGGMLGASPSFRQLYEDRHGGDYFGGRPFPNAGAASGTSTPRFPFPKHVGGSAPGSTFGSAAPNLSRHPSTFSALSHTRSRSRGPVPTHQRHGSLGFSASSSTSPETTHRSSSLFPSSTRSGLASSYSSPPSSVTSPLAPSSPEATTPEAIYPPPRPAAIDLLSRSPSSVLDNSYGEGAEDPLATLLAGAGGSDSCAHLATLTHSNQTLSPFTRSHEHFTARSSPHVINRAGSSGVGAGAPLGNLNRLATGNAQAGTTPSTPSGEPVKAKRKRIHRIGSASASNTPAPSAPGTPRVRVGASSGGSFGGGGGSSSLGSGGLRASSLGVGGPGMGSRAPSELSTYFPSVGEVMGRAARAAGVRGGAVERW
ncbi:hypothetical protein BCR35DRAFT_303395 [Leucosporidium creatinivorum]|uniref:Mitochondrial distribution and morphology protein 34 n=1 Tax=Leucosporidium creatinivorum TaxID=106004 RepID=A0A1Y2FHX6_9BASI|nr:hypothetical protein BCR35DRAFT_303395 [Leucosporidium creatinivorum]